MDEPSGAGVESICRWAGHVGLLGRAVAIACIAGATAEELYEVAEREGYSRAELDALLVELVGSGAVSRIDGSQLTEVVFSNSIPLSPEADKSPKIVSLSIASLMAAAIKSINEETSVSTLFS